MKRTITIALAFAVVIVVPVATAIAGNGNGRGQVKSFTAKQCTAQMRAERGAFQAAFADLSGEHAMRNCKRETRSEINGEFRNAAQECAAERDADPPDSVVAFIEKYGTNLPHNEQALLHGKGFMRNAFGKCVSGIVRGEIEDDVDGFQTAAQQCRADRAGDPDLFLETWGNNTSDLEDNSPGGENNRSAERKAFGRCVSSTARQLEQEVVEEPAPAV